MANSNEVVIPLIIDGKQAVPVVKDLKDELRLLKKEYDSLSVGSPEQKANLERQNKLNEAIRGQAESTKGAKIEAIKLLDSIRGLGPAGNIIDGLSDTLKVVKTSSSGAIPGIQGIGRAIIAIPILALVAGFTSLVAWLKNTDSGAKFLEGSMNTLSNVMDILSKYAIKFGGVLLEVFTAPVKTVEKLTQFLKDPIGTFNLLADGAVKFKNELAKATEAGFELADVMDKIDAAQRSNNEANAEGEKKVSQLLLAAKNKTLTERESLALLDQASKIETENLNRTIDLQKQKIAAVDIEIAQKAKVKGIDEVSDDLLNKRSSLLVEQTNLEKSSLDLQEKIANRRDALLEKEAAGAEKRRLEKEKYLQEEIDLQLDFEQKLEDQDKKLEAEQKAERELARQEAFSELELDNEQKKLALQSEFFGRVEEQKIFEEQLYQVEKEGKEKRMALMTGDSTKEKIERTKLQAEILKGESDRQKREYEAEQRTNKLKQSLRTANYEDAKQGLQLGMNLLSQDEGNRKKFGLFIKGLALTEIAVNLARQISAINVAAAANPLNAVTFGAAGTSQSAIQIGIAVGSAGLQTANVLAQKYEKGGLAPGYYPYLNAALGGIASGSRHGASYGQAGIAMVDRLSGREVGEMEGGEPILARGVALNPTLRRAASAINVLGGGRAFADGGLAPGSTSASIVNEYSPEVLTELKKMNARLDSLPHVIQVTNSIVDTSKKLRQYETIVKNSTL